jgi:hypothetical protein
MTDFLLHNRPHALRADTDKNDSVASSAPSSPASRTAGEPTQLQPPFPGAAARRTRHSNPARSFKLVAIKLVAPGKEHLETHCSSTPSPPLSIVAYYLDWISDTNMQMPTSRTSPSSPASLSVRHTLSWTPISSIGLQLTRTRHEQRPHLRHGLGGP